MDSLIVRMMKIIDLKDSPYSDSVAKNGFDSVSREKGGFAPHKWQNVPYLHLSWSNE